MAAPGDDDLAELHEINVTPFIDVILVLLIIFMIAAPLATVDAPVDLPASNALPAERPDDPLWLTIRDDGGLLVGDDPVTLDALPAALAGASGENTDARIFLRADAAVSYGTLTEVMNVLRAAGWLKIALVGREARDTAAPLSPP
ncbi:MAG: TonB system transport protein ExbD [Rubellimicrobium sp.]|nr:TonB system transport protein ExbD [Rubellimicrobium sp.]